MGEFANSFRDLDVYQDALNLSLEIHEFAKFLPTEERYVLADQMRRASRSVPANISEAWLPAPLPARWAYWPEGRDVYVCCICH
ncbi:four helix bundle protein [Pontiella sulfatireligans]|uniref:four helix bundle protein n=1 Tax=Pontiella sulfatireligans TaxID=2750658 RepID=UPI00109CDDEB